MAQSPRRTDQHEGLGIFVGRWSARGMSYGGTDQSGDDPKAHGETWISTHETYWHTGKFFVVQDERADISGSRFDTLSILGVQEDGTFFSRSVENHGFYRDYAVTRDGDTWRFDGPTERATVRFEHDRARQVWCWEWKPGGVWLPLCDRAADRID